MCPMSVILAFEHNIRVVSLFGSGLEDIGHDLGELHYHIGLMCMLMVFLHSLFSAF